MVSRKKRFSHQKRWNAIEKMDWFWLSIFRCVAMRISLSMRTYSNNPARGYWVCAVFHFRLIFFLQFRGFCLHFSLYLDFYYHSLNALMNVLPSSTHKMTKNLPFITLTLRVGALLFHSLALNLLEGAHFLIENINWQEIEMGTAEQSQNKEAWKNIRQLRNSRRINEHPRYRERRGNTAKED